MKAKQGILGAIMAVVAGGLYLLFPIPKAPVPVADTIVTVQPPFLPEVTVPDEPLPQIENPKPEAEPEVVDEGNGRPPPTTQQSQPKKQAKAPVKKAAPPKKAPACPILDSLFGGL